MAPRDEESTRILLKIAEDIGGTRSDINNLKENVSSLTDDFKDVKDQLTKTVKQRDCTERHAVVARSINSMKEDILAEIKKVPTGTTFHSITPKMLRDAVNPIPTVQELEEAIEVRKEEKAEKHRKALTFWLATITAVIALLSGCAVGVYKLVVFMNKLESAVNTNTQQVQKTKVVYVKVPLYFDGGMEPNDSDQSMIPKKIGIKKHR